MNRILDEQFFQTLHLQMNGLVHAWLTPTRDAQVRGFVAQAMESFSTNIVAYVAERLRDRFEVPLHIGMAIAGKVIATLEEEASPILMDFVTQIEEARKSHSQVFSPFLVDTTLNESTTVIQSTTPPIPGQRPLAAILDKLPKVPK